MRLEREPCERLGILGAVIVGDGTLAREGHPEPQGTLPALYVPTFLFPRLERRERPEWQTTLATLHRGEQLVSKTERVERGVSASDCARLRDGGFEQRCERRTVGSTLCLSHCQS